MIAQYSYLFEVHISIEWLSDTDNHLSKAWVSIAIWLCPLQNWCGKISWPPYSPLRSLLFAQTVLPVKPAPCGFTLHVPTGQGVLTSLSFNTKWWNGQFIMHSVVCLIIELSVRGWPSDVLHGIMRLKWLVLQYLKTALFISLCILRDLPQKKIPRELWGMSLRSYVPMERFLDGTDQENSKPQGGKGQIRKIQKN